MFPKKTSSIVTVKEINNKEITELLTVIILFNGSCIICLLFMICIHRYSTTLNFMLMLMLAKRSV